MYSIAQMASKAVLLGNMLSGLLQSSLPEEQLLLPVYSLMSEFITLLISQKKNLSYYTCIFAFPQPLSHSYDFWRALEFQWRESLEKLVLHKRWSSTNLCNFPSNGPMHPIKSSKLREAVDSRKGCIQRDLDSFEMWICKNLMTFRKAILGKYSLRMQWSPGTAAQSSCRCPIPAGAPCQVGWGPGSLSWWEETSPQQGLGAGRDLRSVSTQPFNDYMIFSPAT